MRDATDQVFYKTIEVVYIALDHHDWQSELVRMEKLLNCTRNAIRLIKNAV